MQNAYMLEVLGRKATDNITGFTGTITGMATYLTGCTQLLLEAKDDTNGKARTRWVDDSRCVVQGIDPDPGAEGQGGPQPHAPIR